MSTIAQTLNTLQIGEPHAHRNLSIFPLLAVGSGNKPFYLTLDQALAQQCLRITEVSASGHVPELQLENHGGLPVLLLDGEELIGCKQNRVLNTTVLAPAHSTMTIPVSCVEQGRWSPRSESFSAAPRTQYAAGRARKVAQVSEALVEDGRFDADQHDVWEGLSAKQARFGVDSATSAMSDLYGARESELREYTAAFGAEAGQTGAIFAINGKVVGLELFDADSSLTSYLPKLVASYALDAIDYYTPLYPVAETPQARSFLHRIEAADMSLFAGVGLGEALRLKTDKDIVGAGLTYEGQLVHLCAFQLTHDINERPRGQHPTRGSSLLRGRSYRG